MLCSLDTWWERVSEQCLLCMSRFCYLSLASTVESLERNPCFFKLLILPRFLLSRFIPPPPIQESDLFETSLPFRVLSIIWKIIQRFWHEAEQVGLWSWQPNPIEIPVGWRSSSSTSMATAGLCGDFWGVSQSKDPALEWKDCQRTLPVSGKSYESTIVTWS